ncbi:hypothetical protein [Marinobacterium marinum]|uniref:Uncharacterized protein n=1 Tax=Marinobacterium marinum TaxID=2756129 RepID=A0A7W1WZG6_9GAMM|nr:hypothetical protein [Marinobacterium marinum]MBA4503057.1 hypothetical protein [Marinobacterium marinum]
MSDHHIADLLERLEQHACQHARQQTLSVSIDRDDMVRLQALAETYGMDIAVLTPVLLHTILTDIEARMPYKPGSRIIRIEDGDPVYEDVGPMPRYLEAKRKHEKAYA